MATRRLQFEIPIAGKYTIIRGESATGKSTLIRTLLQHDSKITFPLQVVALPNNESTIDLEDPSLPQSLFYGDEDLYYLHRTEFQKAMARSRHCFLLVTRNKLSSLSYSYKDVLKLELQGKIHKGTQMYLQDVDFPDLAGIQNVCTEDEKAGHFVIQTIIKGVVSAKGKDNIAKKLEELSHTLFIADGVGFGSCIGDVMGSLKFPKGNQLYLQESFEATVYQSEFCMGTKAPMWDCPNKEEFYTELLTELFKENGFKYDKGAKMKCLQVSCCYRREKCGLYKRGCKQALILGKLYTELCKIAQSHVT